jgi:hypothetical protein
MMHNESTAAPAKVHLRGGNGGRRASANRAEGGAQRASCAEGIPQSDGDGYLASARVARRLNCFVGAPGSDHEWAGEFAICTPTSVWTSMRTRSLSCLPLRVPVLFCSPLPASSSSGESTSLHATEEGEHSRRRIPRQFTAHELLTPSMQRRTTVARLQECSSMLQLELGASSRAKRMRFEGGCRAGRWKTVEIRTDARTSRFCC